MSSLSPGAGDLRIVLLGTGTPIPDPRRAGPCLAVIAGGRPYIVDCGPGVVRRAAAAHEAGVTELDPRLLDHVFLTHLHSDHTAGLPDLAFTPWVAGRSSPLEVHGPHGTQGLVANVQAAYEADVDLRLNGLEPADPEGWRMIAREFEGGRIYENDLLAIEAFRVRHGHRPAFGFRVRSAGRTIVISGDTAPTDEIVTQALGCDVLIHEAYSSVGLSRREAEWQRYHAEMHTSATQVAEIARRAQPRLLVLYHQLFWDASEEDLLDEVRQSYSGRVLSGQDLQVV